MIIQPRKITFREWYAKFQRLLIPSYEKYIFSHQHMIEFYFNKGDSPEQSIIKFVANIDRENVVKKLNKLENDLSKFYKK